MEVPPSPKFHEYVSGKRSRLVAMASNVTDSGAAPPLGVTVTLEMMGALVPPSYPIRKTRLGSVGLKLT